MLAKRLNNFAEKKSLFPNLQFGFRKGLGRVSRGEGVHGVKAYKADRNNTKSCIATSLQTTLSDEQCLHGRHFLEHQRRLSVYKVRKSIFSISVIVFWPSDIACHDREYIVIVLETGV